MPLDKCPPCFGRGRAWGYHERDCLRCNGIGNITIDPRKTEICNQCSGTGRAFGFRETLCKVCGADGKIDPSPPPSDTGSSVWFGKGGKPYAERKRLGVFLETLSGEVCVCDPYFGPGVLFAVEHLQQCTRIRCLTRNLGRGGEANAGQWVKEFKSEGFNGEFCYLNSGDLHDRYLLTDSTLILIGHGLKDFGNKESFVVILNQEFAANTIIQTVKDSFETHWATATALG